MGTRLSKRNQTKFKLSKQFFILIGFIVTLIALAIILMIPSDSEKIYRDYTASGQSQLSSEHVFKSISFKNLEKKVNNSNSGLIYLYYGSPSCTTCVSNIQLFNQLAVQNEIDRVYYLNSDFTDKYDLEDDDDKSAVNALGARVKFDLTLKPSLIVFKDGEVVFDSAFYYDEDLETVQVDWMLIANNAFGTKY